MALVTARFCGSVFHLAAVVFPAALAQEGFTGAQRILEGERC